MATPQIAGVAALVLNANPTLTPAQVEYILTTTANRNGLIG
jgi:subtilisin family serine protease